MPRGCENLSYCQFKHVIKPFYSSPLLVVFHLTVPNLTPPLIVCLILQFLRMRTSLSGLRRMTKNPSGAVQSMGFEVPVNCLCFCSYSEQKRKGTPQRVQRKAPVFAAPRVNSRNDRLAALMDGVVTFSLFGNQCVPSFFSPSPPVAVSSTFGLYSFFIYSSRCCTTFSLHRV